MPQVRREKAVTDSAVRPAEAPKASDSLIPADVWNLYQAELEEAARAESEADLIEMASQPVQVPSEELEFVSAESEIGMSNAVPADEALVLGALAQLSVFAGLPAQTLKALAKGARHGELTAGQYLFFEGDPAESFYVVLAGTFEVLRRREQQELVLRKTGKAEALGLFGLFSGKVRAASARAAEAATVVEIAASAVSALVDKDHLLHDRMFAYYQNRMIEGFVLSSKLFADSDAAVRGRVYGRFVQKHVAANTALVHPGEVSNLLAVLLTGHLMIECRPRAGAEPRQFEVTPGHFIACTSALTGNPSTVRIFATAESSVAQLGHREIAELLKENPSLRSFVARLPGLSRAVEKDVYCGSTSVPGV